jgi:hypothetical chaperone protein
MLSLHPVFQKPPNHLIMADLSCGIDFGTSNSSVAIAGGGHISLVPVEDTQVTKPSAVFFQRKDNAASYGRAAVKLFFDRHDGRFMRSLKRVLGTPLMKQGTVVNGKLMKFDHIIALFLKNLRTRAHAHAGQEIDNVVMGRPVHFVDNDSGADRRAEEELKQIAQAIGFRHVAFQFEPIAAAFAHEVKIRGEKLAIVADLGGGTSDFTVIRLSDQYVHRADRSSDILANTGVRVGGNDFDKDLSLAVILPEFGYRSTYGDKKLEVPLKLYHDLAEWSKVNFLYTPKIVSQTRQLLIQAHDKKRFGRLLNVLERETGHSLLAAAEDTKIALTAREAHEASFSFVERDLFIPVDRRQFEEAVRHEVEKISNAAALCLRQAMISNDAIDLVILTGGTTEVPLVQSAFKQLFPKAALADENKLSSVGLGLAYDSRKKFG